MEGDGTLTKTKLLQLITYRGWSLIFFQDEHTLEHIGSADGHLLFLYNRYCRMILHCSSKRSSRKAALAGLVEGSPTISRPQAAF